MQQQSGGSDNTNPVGLGDAPIDALETGDEQEIEEGEEKGAGS